MKDKLRKDVWIIIFIIGALIIYNVVPLIASKIEYDSYNILEFLSLILINPLYLVICGILYGKNFEFSWFVPAILAFAFIPTVFLFFELPYIFYLIIYAVFIVASQIFGISLKRLSNISR